MDGPEGDKTYTTGVNCVRAEMTRFPLRILVVVYVEVGDPTGVDVIEESARNQISGLIQCKLHEHNVRARRATMVQGHELQRDSSAIRESAQRGT